MNLGIDVNIWTCRAEGYPVIEFKKRDLFCDGKLDQDCQVKITISNPEYWTDEGRPIVGSLKRDLWLINDTVCFDALVEIFDHYGDGIKDFCDFESCPINLNDPDEHDFINLVSTINSYSGLETWGFGSHA